MATESKHSKREQDADKPQRSNAAARVTPVATKGTNEESSAATASAERKRPSALSAAGSCRMSPAQQLLGRSRINPEIAQTIDRKARADLTRLTLGLSPVSIAMDYFDWLAHLAVSPGKQARMTEKALRKAVRLGIYAAESLANPDTPHCIEPLPHDGRFAHETWRRWPYNVIYQGFLLNQQWWHNATTGVRGSPSTTSKR